MYENVHIHTYICPNIKDDKLQIFNYLQQTYMYLCTYIHCT